MRAVMVQGCTSWAGKSLLATALCRWYADRGLRVVPFKAQNMSTNARVVADGHGGHGEIGVAQWLQALAARAVPDVRMNPVLVKPESGGTSQVVRLGRPDPAVGALPWRERAPHLWPAVVTALDDLAEGADLVVCEGAGSPAETNLRDTDLANMAVARHAGAPVLLVADIDRGGAFAHLYGTWALVGEDRGRLAGFVLNRFRGDRALLGDGPANLTAATGMACAGVLPMLDHDLPDEDGARPPRPAAPGDDAPVVAVVRGPHASNLDEFAALQRAAALRWARAPSHLAGADLVVLPGSKDVRADLDWLRASGLAAAVAARARAGGRVVGICGGAYALGESVEDPLGVEGGRGPWRASGVGLLPLVADYGPAKFTSLSSGCLGDDLPGPWTALAGLPIDGYEIRHARVSVVPGAGPVVEVLPGRAWARGPVLATTLHGLFESAGVLSAVLAGAGAPPRLEDTFDALAAAVDAHLDTRLLRRVTGGLL